MFVPSTHFYLLSHTLFGLSFFFSNQRRKWRRQRMIFDTTRNILHINIPVLNVPNCLTTTFECKVYWSKHPNLVAVFVVNLFGYNLINVHRRRQRRRQPNRDSEEEKRGKNKALHEKAGKREWGEYTGRRGARTMMMTMMREKRNKNHSKFIIIKM